MAAATSAAQEVRVQKAASASNMVSLGIEVANTTATPLSNLKVQYFLDPSDHGSALVAEVDYTTAASLSSSIGNVSDHLAVVTFDLGSEVVPAGATRVINARLHLSSWGAMDFTNDYSYIGLGSTMAAASRLALFQGEVVLFGTLPSELSSTTAPAHKVVITKPAKSIVVSKASIPVEWTVDGKVQLSEVEEELQPGSNLIFRCVGSSCAAVEVYRLDAPHAYEASAGAPDWNTDMVALRSATNLTMGDRSIVRATRVLVGESFSEGFDAKLFAALEVGKNVGLKDRAALHGTYALGGTTSFGAAVAVDAEVGTYAPPTVAMPVVDAVVAGDAVVFSSGMLLPPGKYASLVVPQGGILVLQEGPYSFSSLTIASDAKVEVEGAGKVVVDVNKLVIGDRVVASLRAGSRVASLTFRSSQSEALAIGFDTKLECDLVAPEAAVTLQDRANWNGSVWAKSITIGHDVVVDARGPIQGILEGIAKRIGSEGLENLRVTSSRGVLHISDAKYGLMKRAELLPIWGDSGFTYLDGMGFSRSYAPYVLEYSPKSPFFLDEGMKLSASDAVVVGSETVDGVDCWKVRISRFVAPWYFFAFFPENELMSGSAVVWFAKSGARVARIDLSVDDPRDLPFTEEDVPATRIGRVLYRLTPGPCNEMALFSASDDVTRFRIAVKADGLASAGTALSEIAFYQNGARVSPLLSAAGPSVSGRKVVPVAKGERVLSDGTKIYQTGDRELVDAWKLFNGDGVDDGWQDMSTVGDFEFDVEFQNAARPDEIRISGPSEPASGPVSIEVKASIDGNAWETIGKDQALSWQAFEIKSRPLSWDRLGRACIPRSLDVVVPGLAMDESDIGFQQWADPRTSTELIDLHRITVATQILPMPEATELDFQKKYSLLAEYKKRALEPWYGLFWQTRVGIAAGGSGIHLDLAVQPENGLPVDYFRPSHDIPKAKP